MSHERVFIPNWPQLPSQFGALSTLRTGGISCAPYDDGTGAGARTGGGGFNLGDHVGDNALHVLHNRTLLSHYLPSNPQWLAQVHGSSVLNLDEPQNNLNADACVTSRPNVVCAILTADCLPVLFCDPTRGVVAAAHAGWRGLVNGVLENTIGMMGKLGTTPEQISAWLGPAIGPSKFEVGEEVRALFVDGDLSAAAAFTPSPTHPGKFYADIYQLARRRLVRSGVYQIAGGEFCTVSQPDQFYSYRRDGVTGRMASLIWVKAKVERRLNEG